MSRQNQRRQRGQRDHSVTGTLLLRQRSARPLTDSCNPRLAARTRAHHHCSLADNKLTPTGAKLLAVSLVPKAADTTSVVYVRLEGKMTLPVRDLTGETGVAALEFGRYSALASSSRWAHRAFCTGASVARGTSTRHPSDLERAALSSHLAAVCARHAPSEHAIAGIAIDSNGSHPGAHRSKLMAPSRRRTAVSRRELSNMSAMMWLPFEESRGAGGGDKPGPSAWAVIGGTENTGRLAPAGSMRFVGDGYGRRRGGASIVRDGSESKKDGTAVADDDTRGAAASELSRFGGAASVGAASAGLEVVAPAAVARPVQRRPMSGRPRYETERTSSDKAWKRRLRERNGSISALGIAACAMLLRENAATTELRLHCADDTDRGLSSLAKMLQRNVTLEHLALTGIVFGRAGASALARGLRHNNHLVCLSLAGCRVGDVGAAALAAALDDAPLTSLDLSYSGVTDTGVAALAHHLPTSTVRTLRLSCNRDVGADGATALSDALRNAIECPLLLLWLDSTSVGNEGVAALAAALRRNPALTELRLDDAGVGAAGCVALANALDANRRLRFLSLDRRADSGPSPHRGDDAAAHGASHAVPAPNGAAAADVALRSQLRVLASANQSLEIHGISRTLMPPPVDPNAKVPDPQPASATSGGTEGLGGAGRQSRFLPSLFGSAGAASADDGDDSGGGRVELDDWGGDMHASDASSALSVASDSGDSSRSDPSAAQVRPGPLNLEPGFGNVFPATTVGGAHADAVVEAAPVHEPLVADDDYDGVWSLPTIDATKHYYNGDYVRGRVTRGVYLYGTFVMRHRQSAGRKALRGAVGASLTLSACGAFTCSLALPWYVLVVGGSPLVPQVWLSLAVTAAYLAVCATAHRRTGLLPPPRPKATAEVAAPGHGGGNAAVPAVVGPAQTWWSVLPPAVFAAEAVAAVVGRKLYDTTVDTRDPAPPSAYAYATRSAYLHAWMIAAPHALLFASMALATPAWLLQGVLGSDRAATDGVDVLAEADAHLFRFVWTGFAACAVAFGLGVGVSELASLQRYDNGIRAREVAQAIQFDNIVNAAAALLREQRAVPPPVPTDVGGRSGGGAGDVSPGATVLSSASASAAHSAAYMSLTNAGRRHTYGGADADSRKRGGRAGAGAAALPADVESALERSIARVVSEANVAPMTRSVLLKPGEVFDNVALAVEERDVAPGVQVFLGVTAAAEHTVAARDALATQGKAPEPPVTSHAAGCRTR